MAEDPEAEEAVAHAEAEEAVEDNTIYNGPHVVSPEKNMGAF